MLSPYKNALAVCSVLTSVALAQNSEILGCADVDCPTQGDTATNNCTVANSTFINVGVAPITADDNDTALAGLSWVQGMGARVDNNNASRRVFETSFLLGTPPSFYDDGNNGTQRACAVLFHELDHIDPGTDSTCSGIEGACLDALRERARNLSLGDGHDPCERLGEDLRNNFDTECRRIIDEDNDGWPELTVRGK